MKRLLLVAAVACLALGTGGCVTDDTYATCFDSSDCNDPADQCLEVSLLSTFGAMCSHGCTDDSACEANFGFPGRCYSVSGTSFICYQTCDFTSDCWSGNVCIELDLGGGVFDLICAPDNL